MPHKDPAEALAWRRKNRDANRERYRTYWHKWDALHREVSLARSREKQRRWRKLFPDLVRAQSQARRARLMSASGSHTQAEWLEKCALLGNVCIYCGEAKPLTQDHKVPLIRGGSDDIANIVPACKSCNSHKRHWTAMEYLGKLLTATP